MEKQRQNSYQQVSERVERVRRIYSRIGEPLPVEIIIDLYRHLGKMPQMGERPVKNRKQSMKS